MPMIPDSTRHIEADNELTLPAFGVIEPERVLALDNLFVVVSDKVSDFDRSHADHSAPCADTIPGA